MPELTPSITDPRDPATKDEFRRIPAEIHPPSPSKSRLLTYLAAITPPGAPVLRTPELDLPATREIRPPDWNPLNGSLRIEDYYEAVLASVGLGNARARREVVRQLLAPPRHRESHLPVSVLAAAVQTPPSEWDPGHRNLNKPSRIIAAVIRRDLCDEPMPRLSEFLGRSDHLVKLPNGRLEPIGACDGARKDIAKARRYLNAVGAWPWGHADAGRLPEAWWTLPDFTQPLHAWFSGAFRLAVSDLEFRLDYSRWHIDDTRP